MLSRTTLDKLAYEAKSTTEKGRPIHEEHPGPFDRYTRVTSASLRPMRNYGRSRYQLKTVNTWSQKPVFHLLEVSVLVGRFCM